MFGFVICNREGLEKAELDRYQELYCGLCKSLKNCYGQLERLSLSYDMTFVDLLLSALYEPEENRINFRCPVHAAHKRYAVTSKFSDYAAAMTIALSYHKCMDDWVDDHNHLKHQYAKSMLSSYKKVKELYPRQCESIESSIQELSRIEKDAKASADDAINCSGRMLSEIFVYQGDFWANSLRRFGYELGRFIYMMDAVVDYKKDQKKQSYNPLIKLGRQPEEFEAPMTLAIGAAAAEFEKLPVIQDAHLIRNILYGGVWQKYYSDKAKKEQAK